ncbi:MAG: stage III sporulation protein AD [Eubacterium sp.]|nr:stage III sporulation protein AD [Eubacterium sp.]
MDVLKIAALAVSGVLLALMLKQTKPEYSVFVSMAVCICIFLYLLSKLQTVFGYLEQLEAQANIDGVYLDTILKMLGISYITQFASDICKDAGYSAVSSQIELFARVSVLFLSFPVLLALVGLIGEVL